MPSVSVGKFQIGEGHPCFVVAEIGINHNGDLDAAKRLISVAVGAGCQAVKFQKRTIDVVYTQEELDRPRESPFGNTNRELKVGLEFGADQYREIDRYCRDVGILWFASCWDEASVDFMEAFDPPCYKVASASLTDDVLLRYTRAKGRPILMSTGMSSLEQVDHAVELLGKDDLVLFHTNSSYPSSYTELNIRAVHTLAQRYGVPVGYSGHETGIASTVAAVAIGACAVERHITLDRANWGSDQAASLAPNGITRLLRDIRLVEAAMGDGVKRVFPSEVPVMKKLRRVGL